MALRATDSLGSWIRQARKALDLTQSELAERAGCSLKTIAKIESGERRPSKQLAELLALALEIPPADLRRFVSVARGVNPGTAPEARARTDTGGVPALTVAAPSAAEPVPGNLPVPPTRFIGREALLAQVRDMLRDPYARLITLTGVGGVGKTRTAIEAAEQTTRDFPDGAFFISLAPLASPDLLVPTLTRTLGVKEKQGEALPDALNSWLKAKRTLLLLDNFEHLLDAAPLVADLLSSSRGLKVLVTSREVLHLRGEREVSVRPLAFPSESEAQTVEQWAGNEAVCLFVERARDRQPDFALDQSNAAVVVAICRRLEGLPLALELAATRVGTIPLDNMLERLDVRLNMLTGPLVDLPARQRTLRSTIAWSYDLLDKTQQALFGRVAVFSGSFTPGAVQAADLSETVAAADVLAGLQDLADKSLLYAAPNTVDDEPRFGMLETIREYAHETLEQTGRGDDHRRKHAQYYLALAQQAEAELRGARQKYWLDRLEQEHDNFRAALRWALDSGDAELSLLLCGWLTMFWYYLSYFTEGRQWFEEAMRGVDRVPRDLAGKMYNQLGVLAQGQGDVDTALDLYKKSLAVWRESGDELRAGRALYNIGGALVMNARFREAEPYLDEVLPYFSRVGEKYIVSSILNYKSILAEHEGDLVLATSLCMSSLDIDQEIGDTRHTGTMKARLGEIALKGRDAARARQLLHEGLRLSHSVGDKSRVARALENLAAVALADGDAARAARLFGAADALHRDAGAPRSPLDVMAAEPHMAAAHHALGEVNWRRELAAGAAMDIEQAVEYALGG
jgi:predicted ATPase/transcriptional regulator with XRE-family HTH domain